MLNVLTFVFVCICFCIATINTTFIGFIYSNNFTDKDAQKMYEILRLIACSGANETTCAAVTNYTMSIKKISIDNVDNIDHEYSSNSAGNYDISLLALIINTIIMMTGFYVYEYWKYGPNLYNPNINNIKPSNKKES